MEPSLAALELHHMAFREAGTPAELRTAEAARLADTTKRMRRLARPARAPRHQAFDP